MKHLFSILMVLILMTSLTCASCSDDDDSNTAAPPTGAVNEALGITSVPASLGSAYTNNFDRYTKITTPNGGTIHIVAQNLLTNEQIVRCRSILEFYLTDYPGSAFGADKSGVANKMGENNAILTLLNGQDDGSNPVELPGQGLFQNEIQVEGGDWYMNQNFEHRDAAFEEILHLMHDTGIGVDGPNSQPGALPAYQSKIRTAQQNAYAAQLWAIGPQFAEIVQEWEQENSLTQEYLAAVVDSYYGLWGAWTGSATHGMWGGYIAKDRDEVLNEDPEGATLMTDFFHPYLTYNARIAAELDGTFSLKFNTALPYTHHSQYLKDVTLLGTNDNMVVVNGWDNDITGNTGVNTVVFSGNRSEYTIQTQNGITTVVDTMPQRDGTNTIKEVERLQFNDEILEL